MHAAREAGVTIVHSSRAGSGRVGDVPSRRAPGTVLADNLTPQKARVLLTVALTKTDNPMELQRILTSTEGLNGVEHAELLLACPPDPIQTPKEEVRVWIADHRGCNDARNGWAQHEESSR